VARADRHFEWYRQRHCELLGTVLMAMELCTWNCVYWMEMTDMLNGM